MRRIRLGVIPAVLLFASTLAVVAARQAAPTKNGSLEGIVSDSRTGESIPGARIRLTDGSIDPAAYQRLKTDIAALKIEIPPPGDLSAEELLAAIRDLAVNSGLAPDNQQLLALAGRFRTAIDARFRAQTDSEGRFTIENLPPGRYTAHVQSEGYFAAGPAANVVTMAAGGTTSMNLTMRSGGTIAGRVTSNGQPQSGLYVRAVAIKYRNGDPVLQYVAGRNTDDRGEFRLFRLPPGEYLVAVSPRTVTQAGNAATPRLFDTTRGSAPQVPPSSVEQPLVTFYPGTVDRTAASIVSVVDEREIERVDIAMKTSPLYRVSGEVRVSVPPSSMAAASRQGETVRAQVAIWFHDPSVPVDEETGMGVGRQLGSVSIALEPAGNLFAGRFQANNVPPGSYDLRATVYESREGGGNQPATAIVPIEVRGSDLEGLRLEVHPTVTVKGTVTVDGGPPGVNKVRLGLQVEGASAGKHGYRELAERVTRVDEKTGAFSIPGVSMGRFRVLLADNVAAYQFVYREGRAALAEVKATQTDDQGEYRLSWLPPRDYLIAASPRQPSGARSNAPSPQDAFVRTFYSGALEARLAAPVTVAPGTVPLAVDIQVRADATAKVSGRILNPFVGANGQPTPPSATLYLVNRDSNALDEAVARSFQNRTASASGRFEIRNVPPGSYDLWATAQDERGRAAWGRARVNISNRDLDDVAIAIKTGIQVKLRVTVDGGPPPSTPETAAARGAQRGRPANPGSPADATQTAASVMRPSIQVRLTPLDFPEATSASGTLSSGASTASAANAGLKFDPAGVYTLPNVPEGRYRVDVSSLPANAYVDNIRLGGAGIENEGLSISGAEAAVDVIVRTNGTGILRGTVADIDGGPVNHAALIALVPQHSRRGNLALYRTTVSSATGNFTIGNVAPGEYKLFAWESVPADAWTSAEFLARFEQHGKAVSVSAGETTGVELIGVPKPRTN